MKNPNLKKFSVGLAGLTMACVALMMAGTHTKAQSTMPANAAALFGHLGGAFVFSPTGNPGQFSVTADSVGQSSIQGNITDHAQLLVQFPAPGSQQPITLSGTGTWTTSDGKSSITLNVTGTATPDPAGNPYIFNNTYQATITGGTGAFVGATGTASISEVIKFNSTLTGGIDSLTFKGYVLTPPSGN